MQEKYWKFMVQIKAWTYYLDLYQEDSYKWEQGINIFSAVTSSTSIAAWAIWQQLSYVWSAVIAVSQVVNAVKGFLPYNQRLKVIAPFAEELKTLYNKIEYHWFKVSDGELTEDEMNELLYTFKGEYTEIENKNLKDETLLQKDNLMKLADKKTELYFQNNF